MATVKKAVSKVLHPKRELRERRRRRHEDDDQEDDVGDADFRNDASSSASSSSRSRTSRNDVSALNSAYKDSSLISSDSEDEMLFEDAREPDSATSEYAAIVPDKGQDGIQDIAEPAILPRSSVAHPNGHGSALAVDLKPTDRHYLNKALVHLEMAEEWSNLSNVGQLSKYGHPYLTHANGPRSRPSSKAKDAVQVDTDQLPEAPLLSYLSRRFLFTFPGFNRAPNEHWHRIQAFFDSMTERNLSSTPERGEPSKRRVMAFAFNRLFATYTAAALPSTGDASPAHLDQETHARIDRLFEKEDEHKRKLWVDAGMTVKSFRENWRSWVHRLYEEDELDKTFQLVNDVAEVEKLPEQYRQLIDWATLWIAHLIHAVFLNADSAKDNLGLFSRIHSMIPYGLCRYALKIASPAFLAKTMVNFIFSEPLRTKSLFTRVCTVLLNGELKTAQTKIADLSKQLGQPSIVEALTNYVYADLSVQNGVRSSSLNQQDDIVLAILKHSNISETEVKEWALRYRAYTTAVEDDDAQAFQTDGPSKQYALLKALLKAISEKRDREEILKVVLEPNTPEMVKSSVSIFYEAIGSVAAATRLQPHIDRLEAFMDDVVKTCNAPGCNRPDVVHMVRRHAQSVYTFLHEVQSKDKEILAGFIEWDRSAFNFLKEGVPRSRDERAGTDDDILLQLDPENQKKAIEEVQRLASWTKMHKALEDLKHRIDVAQLEDPSFDPDVHELYKRLLQDDPEFKRVIEDQYARGISRPDQAIEWMWYASQPHAFSTIAPTETATSGKSRPPISLEHVRLLLPAYRKSMSEALSKARV